MMKSVIDCGKELSAMTVGTVQLGMNYGIANNLGKPSEEQSFDMLRCALNNGATALDTARAYGTSEEVIGRFLKTWDGPRPYIATKVLKFPEKLDNVYSHVMTSVEKSLETLGVDKVETLMIHSPLDLHAHGDEAVKALVDVKKRGYAERIGASIYVKEDIDLMLKYPELSVTQIPMSIFDQRLIMSGTLEKLKEREYTVFVRSVFLQGLFFLDTDNMTDPILVEYAKPKIELIRDIAKAEGMTVAELAIAFIRDTLGVTSLVLGADTSEQVKENISYFETNPLSSSTLRFIRENFSDTNIPEIMKVLSRPKGDNK